MIPKIETKNLEDLTKDYEFFKVFSSWENFLNFLPVLITAIVVLLIFYLLANLVERKLIKLLRKKANADQVLVANFFGKAIWLMVFAVGVMLAMYILGLGEISGSILGAAGLTTFIVGFALKDIFENFLAGVIIAFDPPFILGSWIEVDGIQGTVQSMSLRETMLKTFDGQDVYIPNAILLKNPLRNYTIDGFIRKEFMIGLDYGDDLQNGLDLIEETLAKVPNILNTPGRRPTATISEFATSSVNVVCRFWIDTFKNDVPTSKIQNEAMIRVLKVLSDGGHYLPADILEIKYYDPQESEKEGAEKLRENIEQQKPEQ